MSLRIKPIGSLRKPEDLFHCKPYNCTISARACLMRQQAATASHFTVSTIGQCIDCSDGKRISKKLNGQSLSQEKRITCALEGCPNRPVQMRRFCRRHVRSLHHNRKKKSTC